MLRLWREGLPGAYSPAMIVETLVPPERMERSYHRRWHATNGHFVARMPFRERMVGRTCTVERSAEGRSFLGAPLFEYRALLQHAGAWAGSLARGRQEHAFVHELRARYSFAFLRASVAQWTHSRLTHGRPGHGRAAALAAAGSENGWRATGRAATGDERPLTPDERLAPLGSGGVPPEHTQAASPDPITPAVCRIARAWFGARTRWDTAE